MSDDTPTTPQNDNTVLGMLNRRHAELVDRLEAESERMAGLKRAHDDNVKRIRAELADVAGALKVLNDSIGAA